MWLLFVAEQLLTLTAEAGRPIPAAGSAMFGSEGTELPEGQSGPRHYQWLLLKPQPAIPTGLGAAGAHASGDVSSGRWVGTLQNYVLCVKPKPSAVACGGRLAVVGIPLNKAACAELSVF